jgi:hypothetical protein
LSRRAISLGSVTNTTPGISRIGKWCKTHKFDTIIAEIILRYIIELIKFTSPRRGTSNALNKEEKPWEMSWNVPRKKKKTQNVRQIGLHVLTFSNSK